MTCIADFASGSRELLQCNVELNKEHEPLLVVLCVLKNSLGCFREKLLVDETMTCQFMLCCLPGISLLRDTVEFVKERCIEFIYPITAL